MAFDFGKLALGGELSSITDPEALFDALPNKEEGYGYLRSVQSDVLQAWRDRRDNRDLVIKTNTGGGKTIVGLLILQCSLNEGRGPAMYITADGHLAAQHEWSEGVEKCRGGLPPRSRRRLWRRRQDFKPFGGKRANRWANLRRGLVLL